MRKTIFILLGCTAILFAGYAGYRGYKIWKQSHMVSLAKGFIAKGDGRNAGLSLNQALSSNPRNVEATRLMAELAEASRSPAALTWRSRVVELSPASLDDRFALVRAALTARDLTLATNTLAGVSAEGVKTAAFHNLAGSVAVTAGQLAEAESHYREASRLEPTNALHRLNLAVVQLQQTNSQALAEARTTLKELCANPSVCCQALRDLIQDAIRYRQMGDALTLSKDLLQQTNSIFSDRLLRLDVLRSPKDPGYPSALAEFQRNASGDPVKAYELGIWQMANTSPTQAQAWMQSLSPATQTNQPLALLLAECRVQTQDWRALQSSLEPQSWGDLEMFRHAFLARALRGQNLASTSKTEWEIALKAAGGRKVSLTTLLRLAAQWKWENEVEEILWTLVNRYPGEKWALQALTQVLYAGGRTGSLMKLYGQQVKSNPSDLAAKNDLAVTALLLDAQELKPHDLALEIYLKSPTNSAFASTYAFSLHVQGKDSKALEVMQRLPLADLAKPSIAGYYALILQATGDKEKAKAYFSWAFKAPLLPEEKKLFEKARSGV